MSFFNKKKIIVTGGAGFIGSHLTLKLAKAGADIIVIDNLWRGSLDNFRDRNGKELIDLEKSFRLADLTNYARCLELIKDADYVFHLADIVAGINYVFDHESFVFRQNVVLNSNTLAACIANRIPNYVYVGTACSFPKHLQMGEGIVALKEEQTFPAEPESSYGWSKLMGEYEAELADKYNLINVGLARFHNVYGPRSSFDKNRSQVLPSLVRKAINYPKEKFIVWGNGEQYRDFVFVDDVVEALLLLAEKGMGKGLIQFGSEKATTIKECAETVVNISGKKIDIEYNPAGPQAMALFA